MKYIILMFVGLIFFLARDVFADMRLSHMRDVYGLKAGKKTKKAMKFVFGFVGVLAIIFGGLGLLGVLK